MKIALAGACALFLFSSCNAPEFKVGECVQQPDSVIVWKITEVAGERLVLKQDQNPQLKKTQESSSGKGWIKTQCL